MQAEFLQVRLVLTATAKLQKLSPQAIMSKTERQQGAPIWAEMVTGSRVDDKTICKTFDPAKHPAAQRKNNQGTDIPLFSTGSNGVSRLCPRNKNKTKHSIRI